MTMVTFRKRIIGSRELHSQRISRRPYKDPDGEGDTKRVRKVRPFCAGKEKRGLFRRASRIKEKGRPCSSKD